MKKVLSIIALSFVAIVANAQYQLTNPGFDGTWSSITPYTGGSSKTVGTTPSGWCVANVAGYKFGSIWFGSTEVASRVDGHTDYACKLENQTTAGNVIPGYVTLGTSWNTADTSGGNSDGGSFGGVSFTGTPDAMEFYYQRTASDNSQPASVVAYMWKGSTSQASVPVSIGSSPTTATMTNRDRSILDMTYSKGGTVTKSSDFSLIATLSETHSYLKNGSSTEYENAYIAYLSEEKSSWTKKTVEFTYHNNTDKPTMINIVFAAVDFFTNRSNHISGNTLTVDDVKFLYYSELATATYDENAVSFTNGTATVNATYDASKLALTSNGHGATIEKSYNESTGLLTITVKGENFSEDATNYHTYTIQFNLPQVAGDLDGSGEVDADDIAIIINMIKDPSTKTDAADLNGDSEVNVGDITAAVNLMLNK